MAGADRSASSGHDSLRTTPARIRHGDCVGEIALLCGPVTPATATVEAVQDSTLWVLTRQEFKDLVDHVPLVADRLSHIALARTVEDLDH